MITETNDLIRCFGSGDSDYEEYHDHEWGHEVRGDGPMLERMVLEGFQSGLSWSTILRKRDNFRAAFAGFDPDAVAAFGDDDVERLMADAGIVRNRRKIEAAISNARATVALRDRGGSLSDLVWSHSPAPRSEPPASWEDVPAATDESKALAKELKAEGFVFVGPTTMYALMQAVGMVDDHIAGCISRKG
ncbi:DNA-3-methyladenine glycosylase I [Demequina oxidasica]|uniref:DNA-3-methyladenine glycosylase I n=1 Tax=Demequina oxidasica TaxID=676199 RepID=UPI0007807239|nr:DNA-3-methyladenine glycosylase I [Demequina oxidasica]